MQHQAFDITMGEQTLRAVSQDDTEVFHPEPSGIMCLLAGLHSALVPAP